ncbi:MAG: hypothetical protein M1830_004321 [Pleopsidium flavum]|nr:MAG: hypothetical protein M1830_004321 [Pleopsidium flavum]
MAGTQNLGGLTDPEAAIDAALRFVEGLDAADMDLHRIQFSELSGDTLVASLMNSWLNGQCPSHEQFPGHTDLLLIGTTLSTRPGPFTRAQRTFRNEQSVSRRLGPKR